MINIQRNKNNIMTLSIENKENGHNIINEKFLTHLETLIEEITRDDKTRGVIITSPKKDFLLGADLEMFLATNNPKDIFKLSRRLQESLRKLETWGRPVVAALSGSALGGGLELALACHYRVAINHNSIRFGLPEISLGLMPGGGGTQRLCRLIGIEKALPLLLTGRKLIPSQAREVGLINELADNQNELIEMATAFIEQNPESIQPWDESDFSQDPLHPKNLQGLQFFTSASARLLPQSLSQGQGPQKILSAVYEGTQLPLEKACEVEAQYFAELFQGATSKNMIKTLFYGVKSCKSKGKKQLSEFPEVQHIGCIGAGIMGAGIAEVAATKGVSVILKDVDLTQAEMAKNTIRQSFDRMVKKGRITEEVREVYMGRIQTTDTYEDFKECDLVIEAVLENKDLKTQVYKDLVPHLKEGAILATNTSSIPLKVLGANLPQPQNFVGLHFFSPVPQMPLVEIIKGDKTDQKALLTALKFVHQCSKVPIIVRDSFGFFTTRVFTRYITEAIKALNEGVSPALIENAGRALGFPMGPLAIGDAVSLTLMRSLLQEKAKLAGVDGLQDEGDKFTLKTVETFIEKFERKGKKSRKGFYDYPKEGPKALGEATKTYAKKFNNIEKEPEIEFEDLKDRLFYIQLVETLKCFEEGVLNTAHEGDVGSIMGWGFPARHGGIVSACHQDSYKQLLEKLTAMETKWGKRFAPPKILKTLMNKNYSTLHEAREILSPPLLED